MRCLLLEIAKVAKLESQPGLSGPSKASLRVDNVIPTPYRSGMARSSHIANLRARIVKHKCCFQPIMQQVSLRLSCDSCTPLYSANTQHSSLPYTFVYYSSPFGFPLGYLESRIRIPYSLTTSIGLALKDNAGLDLSRPWRKRPFPILCSESARIDKRAISIPETE